MNDMNEQAAEAEEQAVADVDTQEVAGADAVTEAEPAPNGEPDPVSEPADPAAELERIIEERTADLQRLQAEYVNYKKRVDRDRALARQSGIEAVCVDLLPVLDAISAAEEHGDLVGGFKLVADEVKKMLTKHGVESFGAKGDAFDPQLHEALMQMPMEDIDVTTCAAVMQVGYKIGGRVIRPARVAVAEPSSPEPSESESSEEAGE